MEVKSWGFWERKSLFKKRKVPLYNLVMDLVWYKIERATVKWESLKSSCTVTRWCLLSSVVISTKPLPWARTYGGPSDDKVKQCIVGTGGGGLYQQAPISLLEVPQPADLGQWHPVGIGPSYRTTQGTHHRLSDALMLLYITLLDSRYTLCSIIVSHKQFDFYCFSTYTSH